jgi:hypothetical protein
MRAPRLALAAAALVAILAPRPADASTQLGLGADWLLDPEDGAFQLTFAVDQRIAKGVTFGGRFGAAVLGDPTRIGVPLDARLRFRVDRLYVEGLVGPWIVFDDDDALRFHAAVGFGVVSRSMQVGLELGYLDPTSMIGLRLAFPF